MAEDSAVCIYNEYGKMWSWNLEKDHKHILFSIMNDSWLWLSSDAHTWTSLTWSLNQWINKSPLLCRHTKKRAIHTRKGFWIKHVPCSCFVLHSQCRRYGVLLWDPNVRAAGVLDLLAAGRDGLLLQEDLQVRWAESRHSVSLTQMQSQMQMETDDDCDVASRLVCATGACLSSCSAQ